MSKDTRGDEAEAEDDMGGCPRANSTIHQESPLAGEFLFAWFLGSGMVRSRLTHCVCFPCPFFSLRAFPSPICPVIPFSEYRAVTWSLYLLSCPQEAR